MGCGVTESAHFFRGPRPRPLTPQEPPVTWRQSCGVNLLSQLCPEGVTLYSPACERRVPVPTGIRSLTEATPVARELEMECRPEGLIMADAPFPTACAAGYLEERPEGFVEWGCVGVANTLLQLWNRPSESAEMPESPAGLY